MVRGVEPSTAAGVDTATIRQAVAIVDRLGTDNQREIAKLCGQLESLKKHEATNATGEQREEAEQMFTQGQATLKERFSTEQKFEQIFT